MTTFNKREDAFEKQFAHDEELRFKAAARRNRLLGLWAAEKLGKSGEDAEIYAREVVVSDLEEPGEEDVFRKIRGDLDAAGVQQSDHQIRRTMDELLAKAMQDIPATAVSREVPGARWPRRAGANFVRARLFWQCPAPVRHARACSQACAGCVNLPARPSTS